MMFESSYSSVTVFLLNYVFHSTSVLLCTLAFIAVAKRLKPDIRALLWKTALVGPLVSAVGVTIAEVPHGGYKWTVESAQVRGNAFSADAERASYLLTMAARTDAAVGDEDGLRHQNSAHLGQIARHETVEGSGRILNVVPISILLLAWSCGIIVTGLIVLRDSLRLAVARRRASALGDEACRRALESFRMRAGIRRPVALLETDSDAGPFVAGWIFPVIFIPRRLFDRLSADHRNAVLAHEVAHLVRRDPLWNFVTGVICGCFLFQPLNLVARRRIKIEAELLADWSAARLLGGRMPLADCLTKLGDWLIAGPTSRSPLMAAGMASYRSLLGRRVEALLDGDTDFGRSSRRVRVACYVASAAVMAACVGIAPRASADQRLGTRQAKGFLRPGTQAIADKTTTLQPRIEPMNRSLALFALTAGLASADAAAAEPPTIPSAPQPAAATAVDSASVPKSLHGFSGMLLGRLVARDVERGEFIVTIDYVPRVWKNNTAAEPRSAVGKTFVVEGVSGKWLDQLLLLQVGDTLAFEAQHLRGDRLRFLGEWLQKAPAYRAEEHPEPPKEFRGFHGVVIGRVEEKREDALEIVLNVSEVEQSASSSRAADASSVVDHKIVVAGFWSPPFRKQFESLEIGSRIRIGLEHTIQQSDHLSVIGSMRTLNPTPRADAAQDAATSAGTPTPARP